MSEVIDFQVAHVCLRGRLLAFTEVPRGPCWLDVSLREGTTSSMMRIITVFCWENAKNLAWHSSLENENIKRRCILKPDFRGASLPVIAT